jgi:hypothetical protein
MPRYFFDVQAGSHDGADAQGTELGDEHDARREALVRAARTFTDSLSDAEPAEVLVHVREGDHNILVVRLAASITQADPRGEAMEADELNSGNDV